MNQIVNRNCRPSRIRGPGYFEQLANDGVDSFDFFFGTLNIFTPFRFGYVGLFEQFEITNDDSNRIADFMGDTG